MRNNKNYVIVLLSIISIFLIIAFSAYIIVLNKQEARKPDFNKTVMMPNDYEIADISEKQMISNYMNDYFSKVFESLDEGYSLLDSDNTKIVNYNDYENFIKMVSGNLTVIPHPKNYRIFNKRNMIYYYVEDQDGYSYTFATKGVMNYKVLLGMDIDEIE